MDFKLAHAYPRVWRGLHICNINVAIPKYDSLDKYVQKRHYKGGSAYVPQYSGYKLSEIDLQPKIIDCLRIKPMTAEELAESLGRVRGNVISAISRLRTNNYEIKNVDNTYVLLNQLEG